MLLIDETGDPARPAAVRREIPELESDLVTWPSADGLELRP
jgi:hypothetical protein